MHPIRLLKSVAFRRALAYIGILGAVTSVVLVFIYLNASTVVGQQTEATIEAEVRGLAEHYQEFGLPQLVRVIEARGRGDPGLRSIYLLADPKFVPLAGNLSAWPKEGRGEPGWITFSITRGEGKQAVVQSARARTFDLRGGLHLLVGRDMAERASLENLIMKSLLGAALATGSLALFGGFAMSRAILRRIDAITTGSQAILEGDLKSRMPVTFRGDEFDRLSQSLNAMLDRIEILMNGMRDVADGIAHDLRSPIARLRGRLERAAIEDQTPSSYRTTIEESLKETDGILATFQAVLDISLAESWALREEFEQVDLGEVVESGAELYQPVAEDQGLSFKVSTEKDLWVRCHRHLVSQSLVNLIDNAVKYSEPGGTISVTARSGTNGPEIIVADHGPGIPEDAREKVLQRFVRLDASRTKPGNGLGLALVAAVARLHDAGLFLEDNEPGLRVRLFFADHGSVSRQSNRASSN